jgi:predicted nucleic acid-binding protein
VSPHGGLVVVDASATVALLTNRRGSGRWVREVVERRRMAAPHLMVFEAGNALRRQQLSGVLDPASARVTHTSLCAMNVGHWPHRLLAARAWELRDTVTYHDASYVALAELLDAPLVTLDRRLAQAPGPRCAFLTPPE